MLDGLANWATDVIEKLGYTGVFLMIVLENVFPPIPSEAILPLAGFLAGEGEMWLPGVILAATLGAVVGALILYYIGVLVGDSRLRWLIQRYGKWFAIKESDLDTANGWFDRYGGPAVMICRVVPIVRSLISLPAGLRRMPLSQFVLYTALGSLVWNCVLVLTGWWLGDNWEEVGTYVDFLEIPVILAAVGAVGWFVWKRMIAPRRNIASKANAPR
jgi:membrane protein DedA with SNARE-associated domain